MTKKKILRGLFYIIIFIVIVFSLILIWPVHRKHSIMARKVESLEKEFEAKNAQCASLNKEVKDLESNPKAVEKVAREKFNLCKEGEVILKYKEPKKK